MALVSAYGLFYRDCGLFYIAVALSRTRTAGAVVVMKLDEKGRCCGRKPIHYKRPTERKFCDRCDRAYDPKTGWQLTNWAWKKDRLGRFMKIDWRGK